MLLPIFDFPSYVYSVEILLQWTLQYIVCFSENSLNSRYNKEILMSLTFEQAQLNMFLAIYVFKQKTKNVEVGQISTLFVKFRFFESLLLLASIRLTFGLLVHACGKHFYLNKKT